MRPHPLQIIGTLVAGLLSVSTARADFVSDTLASAGPSHWAILALNGAQAVALNGPGTTLGNVGISSGGTLSLGSSNPFAIVGNVFLGNTATATNQSEVNGTVLTNQDSLLNQANADALNAATTFAALVPTQSVTGGAVTGNTTVNGLPGRNVLNLSQINLGSGQVLTLNGPAGSEFIINVSGNVTLNSGRINLAGGVTANDVVLNVAGTGDGAVHTTGGLNNESVINGIVLTRSGGVLLQPGLINGELIAGGQQVQVVSGASVNPVPEPSSGQSALDGFDPNANGTIRAVVVQPDGKILIGGDFTSLNGGAFTRNHIARLNPDGTVDTAFDPNANGSVFAIAVQADGKVLAGGIFTSIGGQSRSNLARLDATAGAADSFAPNPNVDVMAIAVQADGKILVGGDFSSIGGQTRLCIARLDPTTGLADSFNPNSSSTVDAILVLADGRILVGGDFSGFHCIGGQTRNFIARLDPTTGLADSFNPNANDQVNTIAVQANGRILAGGFFTGIGGQTRNRIARLDAVTGLADSFNPNVNGTVNTIAVQADGKIVVGGAFNDLGTGANSIGGQSRNRIARLDPTTGGADSFDPNANNAVIVIAVQADGKILAGGQFATAAPNGGPVITRNHIARLETTGGVDQTVNLNIAGSGSVSATALQPDGKIIIGGIFSVAANVTHHNIARLNPDGTVDTNFNPSAGNAVNAIAMQADGKILIGGVFQMIIPSGGAPVRLNHIARLNSDGTPDTNFNPNANGNVYAIAVQADGRILVGGDFTTLQPNGALNPTTRNRIARLNPDGTLDTDFDANANNTVNTLALQADGKILVGGNFNGASSIGGQARNDLARLDPTTGLADSFNPNGNDQVNSIVVQADGKILVGGLFSSIGGQTRNHIARLNPDTSGTLDAVFYPITIGGIGVNSIAVQADGKVLVGGGLGAIGNITRLDATTGTAESCRANPNDTVYAMTLQADGKILAGGAFTSIGGQPRNFFARLTNDTAALQNLAVTQTTVTWTRGACSPQFNRVIFESSTDNATYTLLGSGIPQSGNSNWTLTGLNLSAGQNIYIRARGYFGTGQNNGSGSIVETVRNALTAPALKIVSVTHPANGHIVLQCLGVPNQVNDLQVSPDLSPNSFTTVSSLPAAADATGAFSYDDADAVSLTKRFYRLAFP